MKKLWRTLKRWMSRALALGIKGCFGNEYWPVTIRATNSAGWQTFCTEGNQHCLSMQVWGYIYAEWASTETFMSVFLVVFSHPEIVIKKKKKSMETQSIHLVFVRHKDEEMQADFSAEHPTKAEFIHCHGGITGGGHSRTHNSWSCCLLGGREERRDWAPLQHVWLLSQQKENNNDKKHPCGTAQMCMLFTAAHGPGEAAGLRAAVASSETRSPCTSCMHWLPLYGRETKAANAFAQPYCLPAWLRSSGMGVSVCFIHSCM